MEISNKKIYIIPSLFSPEEQTYVLNALRHFPFRRSPSFLGQFDYSKYTMEELERLDAPMYFNVVKKLMTFCPKQEFNTVFIQRYRDGAYVARHRDPKNNVGYTIIAVFGEFSGAISRHDGYPPYHLASGDIAVQPCTIDGQQGGYHSVDTIIGERYAVILNTIV